MITGSIKAQKPSLKACQASCQVGLGAWVKPGWRTAHTWE